MDEGAKRLGKSRPFFDAVAAGDYEGAALIARHSRRSWAQGEEYEEDFLFVDFLMKLFFLDAPARDCEALLERYEACLQGAEDLRLDICKALLSADSEAFNEALERFLEARKDSLEEMAETQTFPEEMRATEWNLSVEGVALARLAERKGLRTEEEYLHVPSLAREDEPMSFHEDSWKDIDA
ncbi:Imm49 family immunity protein [Archangium lansingense]|uniref:Imm49 family immunity protein n=1 Tax=Archangium lansingense TaxID=2995310 RepID=UPI003B7F6F66